MTKFKFSITTPHGDFTRTATKAYTHIVVRASREANDLLQLVQNGDERAISFSKSGVQARWVKDDGFVVTWHGSERAARAAAAKPYGYDTKAVVLGIYAVAAPATEASSAPERAFQEYFWNLNAAGNGFAVDEDTARAMFAQR